MMRSVAHKVNRGHVWLFLLIAVGLFAIACSQTEPFQGTTLTPGQEATPFDLIDQFGQPVSFSDFDDSVVVLTFLYTNCPDVCPITTSQLRDAHEMLGEDADNVSFVAISIDPERDTIDELHRFSDHWEMTDNWSYLVGDEDTLRPIWESYYIDPTIIQNREEEPPNSQPPTPVPSAGGVRGLQQDILQRYLIIHSAPVYIIDRNGVMRVVFTLPFDTEALVHDVRQLIG